MREAAQHGVHRDGIEPALIDGGRVWHGAAVY